MKAITSAKTKKVWAILGSALLLAAGLAACYYPSTPLSPTRPNLTRGTAASPTTCSATAESCPVPTHPGADLTRTAASAAAPTLAASLTPAPSLTTTVAPSSPTAAPSATRTPPATARPPAYPQTPEAVVSAFLDAARSSPDEMTRYLSAKARGSLPAGGAISLLKLSGTVQSYFIDSGSSSPDGAMVRVSITSGGKETFRTFNLLSREGSWFIDTIQVS